MISRKIAYLLLIIISFFFYILFVEKLSFYIMIFVLAFPLALLFILIMAKINIKCTLSPVSETAVKKSECKFRLKILNKTFFPFPSAVVKIRYFNEISGNTDYAKIAFPIHPKTSQSLTFSLSSDFCGVLNTKIMYIKIYDYIKLFSCKIKSDTHARIYIIPDNPAQIVPDNICFTEDSDSNEFSASSAGDDPSEIFELKDYVPGDKLNRIHWNLSSRHNQLISKHYSLSISSPVVVIADITFDTDKTNLIKTNAALEIFYTISFSLTESGISHKIYINGFQDTVCISDCMQLNEIYIKLLKEKNSQETKTDIVNSLTAVNSKIFIVTNKKYENYIIPEIPANSEMKCFFTGNETSRTANVTDNISVILADFRDFESLPEDLLFNL